jgi:hypothetical protein
MKKISAILACLLLASPVARAAVIYQFEFTNLVGAVVYPDFELTLKYDTYLTTTGLMPLSGPALPTSLGFSVTRAGTDSRGDWGFDGADAAILIDNGFTFDSASIFFRVDNSSSPGDYITSPGTYFASFRSVLGNGVPSGFFGSGKLLVSTVPEASTLFLLGFGLTTLAGVRRRKR